MIFLMSFVCVCWLAGKLDVLLSSKFNVPGWARILMIVPAICFLLANICTMFEKWGLL